MVQLFFYYSSMNAGKSTLLLQSAFNYEERGMKVLMYLPKVIGRTEIYSRMGLQREAIVFDEDYDFMASVGEYSDIACVLIDEAQFLTKAQVMQLGDVCDYLNIPVLCYGIRTDFQGETFEGSKYLLALADKLKELKTICICGKKATRNMRIQPDTMIPVNTGPQVEIGDNTTYISLCRKCYNVKTLKKTLKTLKKTAKKTAPQ